jgi:hypothetical protein
MLRLDRCALRLVAAAGLLVLAPCAWPQDRAAHIEKVEWTWADRPAHVDARLPNVLLLGDSISRAYYEPVEDLLAGKANVYLFATSAAVGADMLLEQIRAYAKMVGIRFEVVHLNNGMHGRTYSEAEYRAAYPEFLATVQRQWPAARCIVATTTPVRMDDDDSPANARIVERNVIASGDGSTAGCRIDDQHALMLQHQDLHDGNVHYTAAGARVQAEQVAALILRALPAEPARPVGRAQPLEPTRPLDQR